MAQAVLADGFVSICIGDDLNFLEAGCRVLLEGQYTGTAVPANEIVHVTGVDQINAMFGAGSILAEGLRKLFCVCSDNIDIYALPRADAAAGVAAVHALTFTGPATSDGRMTFFMGEADYNLDFLVRAGATAEEIAADFVAEVPANFPFIATVSGTNDEVVLLTARNKGTIGNILPIVYNWAGRANFAPGGVTVALSQTVQGSVDPVPAADTYADTFGECCYSCYGLLSNNPDWQDAVKAHLDDAWDCSKPQCFGHGYTYNSGTLGQVLATGNNAATLSRIAINTANTPAFPWMEVVNYAGLSCCLGCDNPEVSIEGETYGLLSCVLYPASCKAEWSVQDRRALQAAGFVVLGPSTIGTGTLTSPYVYNDVTNYLVDGLGRPNETFRSVNQRRLATSTAIAMATKFREYQGVGFYARNTRIREGIIGTNLVLITADYHAWAQENVGVLFSEFTDINKQLQILTDAQMKARACTGKPGKLHVKADYEPPVRITNIDIAAQPRLLENCDR